MNKRYLFSIILILIAIVFIVLISSINKPSQSTESTDSVQNQTLSEHASQNQEQLLRVYLTQNISSISPEKETVGGKFYITKVTVLSNDTATVSYEDGHNAYTAKFNYVINNGLVSISNFAIVPDDNYEVSSGAFDNEGTVVDGPRMFENWSFIYEDNGIPVKVPLWFSSSTLCKANNSEIECFALSTDQFIKPQDHVRIEGKLEDNKVIVTRLTKL